MNSFPKKYKTQDLRNRAKIYRDNKRANNIDTNNSTKFFLNVLPISKKLSGDRKVIMNQSKHEKFIIFFASIA